MLRKQGLILKNPNPKAYLSLLMHTKYAVRKWRQIVRT